MSTKTIKKPIVKKDQPMIEMENGTKRAPVEGRTLRQLWEPKTKKRLADEKAATERTMPITQSKLNPHKPGSKEYDHLKKSGALDTDKSKPQSKSRPVTPLTSKTITIVNKANPHAEGSKRGKHWEKLLKLKNPTTATYSQAGGRMNLLPEWERKKHIKLDK